VERRQRIVFGDLSAFFRYAMKKNKVSRLTNLIHVGLADYGSKEVQEPFVPFHAALTTEGVNLP
jgi:hypothetical protein